MHLDIDAAAREICRVGRSLYERGYVHATAGNISVRLEDGFLITPTDACLGELDAQRLAFVGHDGVQRRGERASKTLALHRRIYAAAPEAGCVSTPTACIWWRSACWACGATTTSCRRSRPTSS